MTLPRHSAQAAVTGEPAAAVSQAALGLAPGLLADALLLSLDALDALVAVKEIASGRYTHVNARMAAWLAGPATRPAELLGRTDTELLGASVCAPLRAAEESAAATPGPHLGEHRIEHNGERREFTVVRLAIAPMDGGAPRLLLGLWTETTRERQTHAQLQRALAQIEAQQDVVAATQQETSSQPGMRDAITGLYHQAHFDDQLRREVDLSSREHREFALVAVTLDPPAGEVLALGAAARVRVLDALGRLLADNTRTMDGACRLAEDRFAILLSGVGLATAHSRREGLRRQCATQIVMHEGHTLGFTVSMGVASFPHTADTRQDLLDAADSALRQAQRRGGNHVTLASIRFEAV
jgi:diguanylate cyclase (GGDEF)-like protein